MNKNAVIERLPQAPGNPYATGQCVHCGASFTMVKDAVVTVCPNLDCVRPEKSVHETIAGLRNALQKTDAELRNVLNSAHIPTTDPDVMPLLDEVNVALGRPLEAEDAAPAAGK